MRLSLNFNNITGIVIHARIHITLVKIPGVILKFLNRAITMTPVQVALLVPDWQSQPSKPAELPRAPSLDYSSSVRSRSRDLAYIAIVSFLNL